MFDCEGLDGRRGPGVVGANRRGADGALRLEAMERVLEREELETDGADQRRECKRGAGGAMLPRRVLRVRIMFSAPARVAIVRGIGMYRIGMRGAVMRGVIVRLETGPPGLGQRIDERAGGAAVAHAYRTAIRERSRHEPGRDQRAA